MASFAQWNMNRPSQLARYEEEVHPRFVRKYAHEELTFEDLYRLLRAQAPDDWAVAPGDVLVDVGCGTGWFARRLAADERCRGAEVHGFDLSENALTVARNKQKASPALASVDYQVGDVVAGLPVTGVHEAWFCGAWHQTGDERAALHSIADALASDGLLHVQTYVVDEEAPEPVDRAVMRLLGHRVFDRAEIDEFARDCGLAIEAYEQRGMVALCTMRPA